tara:strand:- start:415 stop:537 length:123 start_codon:yes stop_codon:yes gene_type:complete
MGSSDTEEAWAMVMVMLSIFNTVVLLYKDWLNGIDESLIP